MCSHIIVRSHIGATHIARSTPKDQMGDSDDSSSSSYVSISMASTTASDGDYWKADGFVCGRCSRPWKWDCQHCQMCRDAEKHLSRVKSQLKIRPPHVIAKAEGLSARPGFSTEWYSVTPCRIGTLEFSPRSG